MNKTITIPYEEYLELRKMVEFVKEQNRLIKHDIKLALDSNFPVVLKEKHGDTIESLTFYVRSKPTKGTGEGDHD